MAVRQLGELVPLSIATACAIEAILKIQTEVKETALWINLMTLYRNLRGAYGSQDAPTDKELYAAFEDEVKNLLALGESTLPGDIKVKFYLPSYQTLQARLGRYAKFKVPTTKKQIDDYMQMRRTLEWFTQQKLFEIVECTDSWVNGNNERAFIITHHPVDLLSYPSFRELTLVESHTGAFKKRDKWNTKLTSYDKHPNMPFNLLTLQVIGDHSTMFRSMGPAFNAALEELATRGHYTVATTEAKILFDLDRHKDKLTSELLKEMLRIKLR